MRTIKSTCEALLIGSAASKMWFSHFRTAPDYDFYVLPSYPDRFIYENPTFKMRKRDLRKMTGILDNKVIDMTIDTDGSWIGYIMRANEQSQIIDFNGSQVSLATPTTLRLIKEVLSCWRLNWRKHIADYVFLNGIVREAYSTEEQMAFGVGMSNFIRFYPDPGVAVTLEKRLYTLSELEKIVGMADLDTRISIKDKIVELLCGDEKWSLPSPL